jgi:hypothetical protein
MRKLLTAGFLGALVSGAAPAGEPPPSFTKKPTAIKAGDKVRIEFAVDRETDAAVFIEDGQGKVVRHLVAGVLGPKAPPPLKPGLAQSVEWDGKADYGVLPPSTIHPPPFRVRVALGLGAKYDKVVASDPESLNKIFGLGVGPDGTLYAASQIATHTVHNDGLQLVALNRDGTYQRTLIPVPADVTREGLAFLGGAAVEVGGRLAPTIAHLNAHQTVDFWPDRGANLAVTPGGLLLVPQGDMLGAVPLGRAVPPGRYAGAKVSAGGKGADFTSAAVSGDGQWAYVCGDRGKMAGAGSERSKPGTPVPAVYRMKLPERTESAAFFGDPAKAGSDEKHLASPCGLALDGKGHLLVADRDNNRVVAVAEKDGAFAGSFAVEKPEGLAADPKSGAVYVLRGMGKGSAELVKFSGWKDPKALAKAALTINTREGASLALDASASPPVAWVGCYYSLLRIEDAGDKFAAPVAIGKGKSGTFGIGSFEDVTVDRYREDPEIYSRRASYSWTRFNEATGKLDTFTPDGNYIRGPAGTCIVPGPGGNIYALCQTIPAMFKFDRGGKALAWDDPHPPERDFARPDVKDAEERYIQRYAAGKLPPYAVFARVCMGYMTHTMGVRPDGHVFVFERSAKQDHRANKSLREFEPSGKKLEMPIIWNVSDNVVGPKFDQDGNIYIAEQVRPADRFVPPEYAEFVGALKVGAGGSSADARRQVAVTMYGSILKFTPKGGTFDFMDPKAGKPYDGEAKLDPGLKTVDAAWGSYGSLRPAKVVGAEWMHLGVSHVNIDYCNCEHINFDVDPFGRVWYPDIGRYRIDVLDTAGNELAHFGGYGNADSPSATLRAASGKTSSGRGPDSGSTSSPPNDTLSQSKGRDQKLAEPDVALAWPLGVAATDKYAYVGDVLNRRLLRAKLIYAAEETCEVK